MAPERGNDDYRRDHAQLDYRNRYADLTAMVTQTGSGEQEQWTNSLDALGSLVFMRGNLFATRAIDDGFALPRRPRDRARPGREKPRIGSTVKVDRTQPLRDSILRSPTHLPALDGIRGMAVLWVIAHNTTDHLGAPHTGPLHLLALLANPGWIGVQLFFSLSGFLITGGLLDSREAPNYYGGFYGRRALRIMPLYFLTLLALLVILPALVGALPHTQSTVDHQAWLWLFVSNWAPTKVTGDFYGFGHFWSLAVEEQFYLFWPLLVIRLQPRPLLLTCLGIALVSGLARSAAAIAGMDAQAVYVNTFFRMDALALGAAGAALVRIPDWAQKVRSRLPAIGVAAFLLFLAGTAATRAYSIHGLSGMTFGYSILALTSAVLVTGMALSGDGNNPVARVLRWAPLRSCGKYSYAMYVFHVPIYKLVVTPLLASLYGPDPPALMEAIYAVVVGVVSYLLAYLSWHLYEKRWLNLKHRFAPRLAAV